MEIRVVHDFSSLEQVAINIITRLASMPAPEMVQPIAATAPAAAAVTAPDDQKPRTRRGRPSNEEKAATAAATNVTADAAPAVPPVPAVPAQVSPSPVPAAAPAVTAFDPFDAPAAAPAVDPNGPVSEEDLAAMRNIIMDQFIPKHGQAAYDEIRVKHGGPGVRITSLKRGQFDAFRNELLAKLNA